MTKMVSVVIPTFNDAAFLEDAIKSVMDQTYVAGEVIVVDDGTSDSDSNSILKTLSASGEVTVIKQRHQGPAAARNTGIMRASGEYILPLDADDTLEKTFIEKTLEVLLEDEKVKASSSWAARFGDAQGIIELKGGELKDFIADDPCTVTALYRKSDWNAIGGYDENMLTGYEDWEFWIRMLAAGGKIHVIKEPLFNYRIKRASRAADSGDNRYSIMEYMVNKNINIYNEYTAVAVLSSENLLRLEKQKWSDRMDKVYRSKSYRLGNALLSPLRLFKRKP